MTTAHGLVERMTREEKATLCTGQDAWTTLPLPGIGLPGVLMADGPHGLRKVADVRSMAFEPATAFPTASCSGSTWNRDLLREMGRAIGREAAAAGVNVVLGPGVNLKRSPLAGRNFEYFSEDPYLTGELAVGWIEGLQAEGVGASLKHFAANNQERRRMTVSAEVDERTLRELYLPAFETAVKRAQPWTVMCAYNKVNGRYASEHRGLLTDVLRSDWGFDGVVLSDWGAVHDRVAAVGAGLDLEMPGPRPRRTAALVDAVRNGALDEQVLNASAERIAGLALRAMQVRSQRPVDHGAHHELARRIAAEGLVLLKNDGVLPLQPGQRLAVVGRAGRELQLGGGGSSCVTPTRLDVPLAEIEALAGPGAVEYAAGYPLDNSFSDVLITEAAECAGRADVALVCIDLPGSKETEGADRANFGLGRHRVALIQAVAAVQPKVVVVLNVGAPVAMAPWGDAVSAILAAWLPGQAGAGAIADVLFGRVNPSGRLAETFPLRLQDTPAFLDRANDVARYGEGLHIGYRWYDAREIGVAYAFGFGLSYTTFAYGPVVVSADTVRDVDGVTVSVDVTNTGRVAGAEVVQVYVRHPASRIVRPVKELKGFAKVHLQPGEAKTVDIELGFRAFAFWSTAHQAWATEDGPVEVIVAASATDLRGSAVVELVSTTALPSVLDRDTPAEDWLADPRGRGPLLDLLQERTSMLSDRFGGDVPGAPAELDPSLAQMPVCDMLEFVRLEFVSAGIEFDVDEALARLLAETAAPRS